MTARGRTLADRILRMRGLMCAPIPLYRSGWGWLLGRRFVMIEHMGRKSHQPRYAVVEVVDRGHNVLRVASGFGVRAQWYRNLAANGVAFLSTGAAVRVPAHVRLLDDAESRAVLDTYAKRHPLAWKILGPAMTERSGGAVVPIVEFTPPRAAQISTAPTS